MDFMGVGGQGYNYPGDDGEHQTNMMIHGNSSPSSSLVSHHGNRASSLTTDGSPWEYSPIPYERQQRQHFPWAWRPPSLLATEKRGDEEGETEVEEEEEISAGKWTTRINEAAGARSERVAVDNSSVASAEREHMFDKVVTPSDVGKLNRLVIPKQHAEKYFPLDSSTNEKGLLLNFEDRSGMSWRFRYSYWNSSQSYVITKGWSRFVKEKRLDAGDIVSFHRGVGEAGKDRLYIDWRRRPDAPPPEHASTAGSFFSTLSFPPHPQFASHRRSPSQLSWTPSLFWRPPPPAPPPMAAAATGTWDHYGQQLHQNYNNQILGHPPRHHYLGMRPVFYHHQQLGSITTTPSPPQHHHQLEEIEIENENIRVQQEVAQDDQEESDEPMVFESVPVVQGMAASAHKKLRLFGVNMECPMPQSECECDVALSSSSTSNQYLRRPALTTILTSQQHPHISSTSTYRLYHGTPLLNKGKASASSSSLDFEMLN